MALFYAHYPSLEKSFLRFTKQNRQALEPWLIVCASSFLAQRLSAQLAREQGAVANIHFCTASALLYKLDAEAGPALPVFPQDHLRDFLLKDSLSEPGLNLYPVSRGFITALKAALRDLADSLADPDILEEQLQNSPDEGEFAQDKQRFAWLVNVYKRYLTREAALPGYRPYQNLFERALAQVPTSAYLKQFSKIILYGFYDMPGRQLEFINHLRAHYPLTVFAPYDKIPAYAFATKFFETNWRGAFSPATDKNTADFGTLGNAGPYLFASQGSAPAPGVKIIPAATPQSEVFFAAKEILRLVEEEHYNFNDIGLIARTQTLYQEEIRRVFAQNKIPLQTSWSYPLQKSPLGAFCLNLFTLSAAGFERQSVLSVLTSAYFSKPKKYAWRKLAEKSLASINLSQWQDLLPITENFDPEFLTWLEHCQHRLQTLDTPGAWEEKCAQARQFLTENIDENFLQGPEKEIYQSICTCIDSLAVCSQVRARSHGGEFVRELVDALSSLSFNHVENAPRGVVFTDALRARGLRFKAVFLMGINEKTFPQIVPEDPILRDRYRYILRDMLGYWINQQAERAQEEQLLFLNACSAATQKLYVSYACRDSAGKEQVPSVYVAELARATGQNWSARQAPQISALLTRRLAGIKPIFLSPKEISYVIMFDGRNAEENYQTAGLSTPGTSRQLAAAAALSRLGAPGNFDGCIQSGETVFQSLQKRGGFSPSALQDLAACPLKFFFRKALHLADKSNVYSRWELGADKCGQVYHKVLEDFYRELKRLGLTQDLFDSGIADYLDKALSKHFTLQSYRNFGIYPVVWELILAQIRQRLTAFVQEDINTLGKFIPSFFEKEFANLPVPELPFKLCGIIDRIDVNPDEKTFFIADYKSSRKGTKDLAQSFFTHLIFQPFLYALAAQQLPELTGFSLQGACLLAINKGYERKDLSASEIAAMQKRAFDFLTLLANTVKQGTFTLNTSDLCTYCPYNTLCRKDHFACLVRARKSANIQQIEEARHGT